MVLIMATEWYWLTQNQEKGPVSFRELAQMVQEHVLNEDDLIRPHYSREWQTADRIVGLFYMARRIPREWPEPEESGDEFVSARVDEKLGPQVPEMAAGDELEAWFREQLAATPVRGIVGAGEEVDGQPDSFQVSSDGSLPRGDSGSWQSAVDAAVSRFDGRHNRQKTCRKSLSERVSAATLRTVFRLGLSLVAMNATILAILSWSAAEAQRHPDQRTLAHQIRQFPGWGPSSPGEFNFLLVDAAVIAAVAGYGGARALEAMTDD